MATSQPVHVDLLSFTYQRQLRQASGDNRPLLEELCRYITPEHATKWKKIGTELGVAYGDLTIIEELYPGLHEICCNEMFEKWLQNDTRATWNKIFAAVGIESWNQIPNYKPTVSDSTDGQTRRQSVDFVLGIIPRHCILHALTVIKEALYKGNSELLEDFIKNLEAKLKQPSTTKSSGSGFKQLQPVPIIPPRSLKRFVDKAISTIEFARVIELSLKEAADEKSKKIDLNSIQMVCWKYYMTEKKDTLPQCSWLNDTLMYQLFVIFNHYLGSDNAMILTGVKMNQLLERLMSPLKDSGHLLVKNSPVAMFDFMKYLSEMINCLGNSHLSDKKIANLIMELYDEKMNGIYKKGNLVKKGGRRKNWKKRWFILKSGALIYYETKENLVMKGMIVLNKSSDALNMPDEKNKLNRFVVMCGESGRGFEMKADSALQKMEWLHAIKKVLESKHSTDETSSNSKDDSPFTDTVYYSYIDSDDDTTATSPSNNKDNSDSDSECYVLPATPVQNAAYGSPRVSGTTIVTPPQPLPSQSIPKQSSQVNNVYKETDTCEYDYPYLDKKMMADVSPAGVQNSGMKKSLSCNAKIKQSSQGGTTSQDSASSDDDDEYEQMVCLKPPTTSMARSISHDGGLKQTDDSYIRMNSEGQPHHTKSVLYSHLNKKPPRSKSQSYYTALEPNEDSSPDSTCNSLVNSSNGDCVYQNVDNSDDGCYLELIPSHYGNVPDVSNSTKPVYKKRKKPQVAPKPAV